jgi:hypothetical protein
MICLCYAKFLPNGSISPGEFFASINAKWSCIEDTHNTPIKTSNPAVARKRLLPKSIVFIVDCQSVKQLTSDIATLPGAGIWNVEIFPVPEVVEYQ